MSFLPVPILSESFRDSFAGKITMQFYGLTVLFIFFGWFWTHGGQTLGMRAWRIKLVTNEGNDMTWLMALKRFVLTLISYSLGGIGLIWCLFNSKNLSLPDKFSGSKMIMLIKRKI